MPDPKLKAPFPWFGGKRRVAPQVWAALGDTVDNYIEPFAGSLAVLLARPGGAGSAETVNDADSYLCNFWRAVTADPEAVAAHCDWPVNECVPAGTKVATPQGDIPIESVRAGMMVYGYDGGRLVPSRVLATKQGKTNNPFVRVGPLRLTANHPVWTPAGYVAAGDLPGEAKIIRFSSDLGVDKLDLDAVSCMHETTCMDNLLPGGFPNRCGAVHRGHTTGTQAATGRALVPCRAGRENTSGLLATGTVGGRRKSRTADCGARPGRRLAGPGTVLDFRIQKDVQSCESDRWRRWNSGDCGHAGTETQIQREDVWPKVSTGQTKCHAWQAPYAGGNSENSQGVHRTVAQYVHAGENVGGEDGQIPLAGVHRSLCRGQDGKAVDGRTPQTHRGKNNKPEAGFLHRDGADLRFNHCGGPRPSRGGAIGCTGDSQGLCLQGISLPVFNLQTTTGNYFADSVLVHNCDLFARHLWLVDTGRKRIAGLEADPDFFDAKVAGWWVWGINQWIGSGWCSGRGPWQVVDGQAVLTREKGGQWRQRPHLGDTGQGVNRKLPHLGDTGRGVNRQLPHLGNTGQGVNRPLPHLGGNRPPGEAVSQICGTGPLYDYFAALAARLRRVRVCCGDWARVVTDGAMAFGDTVGVFLDPPYQGDVRAKDLYRVDDHSISIVVRDWAVAHGDDPRMRIVLAGYWQEHAEAMPATWRAYRYTANAAYQTQSGKGENLANRHNECLWYSPHCVEREDAAPLFVNDEPKREDARLFGEHINP